MGKRQKKDIAHVYTSTKVEREKAIFRVSNFIVLLSMFYVDSNWNVDLPETAYLLVIGAILGVDIAALSRKFLKRF